MCGGPTIRVCIEYSIRILKFDTKKFPNYFRIHTNVASHNVSLYRSRAFHIQVVDHRLHNSLNDRFKATESATGLVRESRNAKQREQLESSREDMFR